MFAFHPFAQFQPLFNTPSLLARLLALLNFYLRSTHPRAPKKELGLRKPESGTFAYIYTQTNKNKLRHRGFEKTIAQLKKKTIDHAAAPGVNASFFELPMISSCWRHSIPKNRKLHRFTYTR